MQPEVRKLLTDILEAATSIADFVSHRTVSDFSQDKLLRSGIYYQFAIIGEAISQLRQLDETLVDQISEHRRIIGFRNQVIHGYALIDSEITCRIIQDKLPILQREVEALLKS